MSPCTRSPRPRQVTAMLAVVAATVLAFVAAPLAHAASPLRSLAEAKSKYIGTELTGNMVNNQTITSLAGAQFDMVTPGNEMKWDTTEPSNGNYNFGPGDAIVSFAQSHNMRVRGHNLVWHSQLPGWVSSLPSSQVQAAMEAHITTEAIHYKGKVYAWDVVNEPFNEDGSLRADAFTNAMGSGYLADALRTAHAADPNAKLYLNDYNIEGQNAKSDAMYKLVSQLKSQGVPIDGVGLESHFIVGQVPSSMRANMQRFTALGLDVAVTELDDRIQLPANSGTLAQQATDYAAVVNNCLAVSRCVGVSQWGVGDADSWIPGTFPGQGAATMYDNNYQPKPAYDATASALGGSTTTTTTTPPPTSTCTVTDSVNAWNTGLTESVTITNTGAAPINGWSLAFTLAGGQAITSAWNASISPASGTVTAKNVTYNGSVAPGGTVSFGFQATHTGDTSSPGDFTLNGTRCA